MLILGGLAIGIGICYAVFKHYKYPDVINNDDIKIKPLMKIIKLKLVKK